MDPGTLNQLTAQAHAIVFLTGAGVSAVRFCSGLAGCITSVYPVFGNDKPLSQSLRYTLFR